MGFVRKIGRAIDDAVHDIGRGIDDLVRDVIPGGWVGVGALALLSIGISNPTLLGLAEEGALTAEALTSAGIDAAAVATDVAALTPEVLSATEAALASGVAPETIAIAASDGTLATLTAEELAGLGAIEGGGAAAGAAEGLLTAEELAGLGADAATAGTEVVGAVSPSLDTAAALADEAVASGGNLGSGSGLDAASIADEAVASGGGQVTGAVNPSAVDAAAAISDEAVASGGNLGSGAGGVEVVDLSGTGVPGAGAGTADPTLLQGAGNLASAVVDTLGVGGTAALLGGAAAASGLLGDGSGDTSTGSGDSSTSPYTWGLAQPLVDPGVNPGFIGKVASQPFYTSTNPTDAQYYWGVHNAINKMEDLNQYNNLPNAPATPWGAGRTAVGGQSQLNIPNFVSQYITNPAWTGVMNAAGPGYTASGPVTPR